MYSVIYSIGVAGLGNEKTLLGTCPAIATKFQRALISARISRSNAALIDAHACVVVASHLRFASSRSIPRPGVRT